MIKTIIKIDDSQGIILDTKLMDMAHLKVGDEMHVTVHENGSLTLTPLNPTISKKSVAKAARRIIRKTDNIIQQLS